MTENLRLHFLGPVLVEQEGQSVSGFSSGKTPALLGYLVVQRRPLTHGHLADLLWQDLPERRGRANLSWTLHKISSALAVCMETNRHTIQFRRTDECWIDLNAFEALAAQDDRETLAKATALYRGTFLEGLSVDGCADYELWLVGERERWRQRAEYALETLIAHCSDCGDPEAALRYARRLLALAPWREATHRIVMRVLTACGRRGAALAQYEACRRALDAELGVAPSAETATLYERIVSGELTLP